MRARSILPGLLCVAACGGGDHGDDGGPSGPSGPFFERPMFFNRDVSKLPVSPDSARWIASLRSSGGWGRGDRIQVDFSFSVLEADATTPRRAFTPLDGFFYTPDCDVAGVPIPADGNLEGETGYTCDTGGDCHLIVFDRDAGQLFEMYKADVGATFRGGCLAVWDTTRAYGESLRGDGCTSADAAGFPIAPLLFTPDEVAAGEIPHAIRFILPNDRISSGFVRPATHSTQTTGPADAPPYGVHLRLVANYPIDSLPNEGAKVVARALQKYGMYHADGGDVALTAASDLHSQAKWGELLGFRDLEFLRVEDFEVVDHGEVLTDPSNCER